MKNKEILRFISNNIKGCKLKIALLSICQVLLGALTVGFSFMLRYIIEAIELKNKELLVKYIIVLSVIAVLLILLQVFYRLYYEVSYSEIENKLKDNLFKTILKNNYQEIKKTHDEEWIHRLTSDTSVIANSILSILPSLCRMVVQLVLALVAIILLYWQFGLSLIPFILIIILITYFMRKRLKECHHEVQEDIFSKKNEQNLEEYKKARLKRSVFAVICSIAFVVVYYTFYILAIVFCGPRIIDGLMTIGLLTALVALLSQLTGPLGNITSIIPRYYSLIASGERLRIEADPEVNCLNKEEIEEYYTKEFKGLEIDNVSYSYLDKYGNTVDALKRFSLLINKNERILIKGHSGGGKTTLFKLMLSLLSPDEGNIYLLDKEKHNLDRRYEKLFGYVPQDNLLMQGTIKEVITLFSNDADEVKLEQALRLSESYDFVNELTLK